MPGRQTLYSKTLTKSYGVVPYSVRAVQQGSVKPFALYLSDLWRYPRHIGRRDDLLLLLNRHARSILGVLHKSPQGGLLRQSGLTLTLIILRSRQQRFAATLANACSSKLKELHHNPSSSEPICDIVRKEYEHGLTTEGMNWAALGKESVVRTSIQDYATAAKSAAQLLSKKTEAKV